MRSAAREFEQALATTVELTQRGFDTRIICTVNQANREDALELLEIADELGVSLVKFHVFLDVGTGHATGTGYDAARVGGVLRHPRARRPDYRHAGVVPATYARRDQMER